MERFLSRYKVPLVAGTLVLFGVLYGLLSFGNHLMFRTYGLDLGAYTHALYNYAHLRGDDCSFFLWEPSNLLADHFDLYLVLISPLVYLFGDYTLLIVQLVALLFGMYGTYRLAHLYWVGELVPLVSMLLLGLGFGVWHAFAFDYHSNVVAALLLPWLLYCVGRRRMWGVVLLAAAIAVAKETSALWVVFVLVALLFDHWRDRGMRRLLLLTAVGCLAWFLLLGLWVMPSLGGSSRGFWRYEWMGSTVGGMVGWLIAHPLEALRAFFSNFSGNEAFDGLKGEFLLCTLLSGGFLLFLKPNYLLMLVPPLAMKMLSQDAGFWGVTYHYNVEVSVVIAMAAASENLLVRKCVNVSVWMRSTAVGLALCILFYTTGTPRTDIRKADVRVFDMRHWRQPDFDRRAAQRMIDAIPATASVCATSPFTPHLATRDSLYLFPIGLGYGAEYFLILEDYPGYYREEDYNEETMAKQLIADTVNYRVVDAKGGLWLLQRR